MEIRERRRQGDAMTRPVLHGHVHPDAKAVVDRLAKALGTSQAQALELILLKIQQDSAGLPTWATDYLPPDPQELPIARSA